MLTVKRKTFLKAVDFSVEVCYNIITVKETTQTADLSAYRGDWSKIMTKVSMIIMTDDLSIPQTFIEFFEKHKREVKDVVVKDLRKLEMFIFDFEATDDIINVLKFFVRAGLIKSLTIDDKQTFKFIEFEKGW